MNQEENKTIINEEKPIIGKKTRAVKTFKEYYSDEEFRTKHKNYMKEKIECECGKEVCRVNISNHKKTPMHKKRLNDKYDSVQYLYKYLAEKYGNIK
jgi:hypothetical protein